MKAIRTRGITVPTATSTLLNRYWAKSASRTAVTFSNASGSEGSTGLEPK